MEKPNLLIISHVLPFPGNSGQSQRVYYTLLAARELFTVTFLTFTKAENCKELKNTLLNFADEAIVIPSVIQTSMLNKFFHKFMGKLYSFYTGLKESNYAIGEVEFSYARLEEVLQDRKFNLVLFEYFHAYKAAAYFSKRNIPTVLDTHNVLWMTYIEHVLKKKKAPSFIKNNNLKKYKRIEEKAWDTFNYVIAINRNEHSYISAHVKQAKVVYMPMGIDLTRWQYDFSPATPPRLAYYGGLGSSHNQKSAMICAEQIMPLVWRKHPDAELWIIGSKPPEHIKNLEKDPRIYVTGFMENVSDVLRTVSVVICPWEGKYGFRSRIVEVMAVGIPLITTPDAIDGMDFNHGAGIFLTESNMEMAKYVLPLLDDAVYLASQSKLASEAVNKTYSFEATYKLAINSLYNEVAK